MQKIYILHTGERYVVEREGQQEGFSAHLGKFNDHEMALCCAEAYAEWQGGEIIDKT
jgi:hypothetical protein